MQQYLDLLTTLLNHGTHRDDRTGVGTRALFGQHLDINVEDQFPLLTTKRIHTKSVVGELLWFLSGSTNRNTLKDTYGVSIWDEWGDENGELGPIYGAQWRGFGAGYENPTGVDQIQNLIHTLKTDPFSRRMVVSAWNPVAQQNLQDYNSLPPCHCLWQLFAQPYDGYDPKERLALSLHLYQRSADIFLGVPFNIASYALLLHMIAQVASTNTIKFQPWRLHISFGDLHLYDNHTDQAVEQILRVPSTLPTLRLNPNILDIDQFTPQDIEFLDYHPQSAIKAPVAV